MRSPQGRIPPGRPACRGPLPKLAPSSRPTRAGRRPARAALLCALLALGALAWPGSAAAGHGYRANPGIWAEQVRYLANRARYGVYFTDGGIILDVKSAVPMKAASGAAGASSGCIVRMSFVGANPAAKVEAVDLLPTSYSYFIGAEPDAWRREVREHGTIVYRDLWPGVDLVFHDLGGQVGYTIDVTGGGDPTRARWTFEGGVSVPQPDGSIVVQTPAGSFTDRRSPLSKKSGWLSFGSLQEPAIASPSERLPWSTFLGGGAAVGDVLVAAGTDGAFYVAGNAGASYAPADTGTYGDERTAGAKIFVARLSAARRVDWVTFLGGRGTDLVHALEVGPDGLAIGGETSSEDFPGTDAAPGGSTGSGSHAFLARLATADGALLWSRKLGLGQVVDLALRGDGAIVAGGRTADPAFPTTPGAYDRELGGGTFGGDGFVLALDKAGGLLWSTLLGGGQVDAVAALGLDAQERPIVAGKTTSTDFPTAGGAAGASLGGLVDAFVARLAADGSRLEWAGYLGGSGEEIVAELAVGPGGDVLVVGATDSGDFPVRGSGSKAASPPFAGDLASRDAFLADLSPDGRQLRWSSCLGGGDRDEATGLALDAQGRVLVTGMTRSRDFPRDAGVPGPAGEEDAFLARFDLASGEGPRVGLLGGGGADLGLAVASLPGGGGLIAGRTGSGDYPTTLDSHDPSFDGISEVFLSELSLQAPDTDTETPALPSGVVLLPNRPNPFNPRTIIGWRMDRAGPVDLQVYDVAGRLVRTLARAEVLPAGEHERTWDGRDDAGREAPSGVYACRLRVAGRQRAIRMTLVR